MLIKTIKTESLETEVYDTRVSMGLAAGAAAAKAINGILATKPFANVIFAAAPSQNEMLDALKAQNVDFSRINAFHMDEYIGLSADAPQGFGNFLKEHIFGLADFRSVSYIDITAADAEKECDRYAELLAKNPTDIVVMGIGENGHIAFNDPPVADFNDPRAVKPVELDPICRNQQVNDGCFATLDDVPKTAITLTVPTLFAGDHLFCIVPAPTKAKAVRATLCDDIGEACPATILRRHKSAVLYLDGDSSSLL